MGPEYGHQLDGKRDRVLGKNGKPLNMRLPCVVFDNGKIYRDSVEDPQQRFSR